MKVLISSLLATGIVFGAAAAKADATNDIQAAPKNAFIEEFDNTLAPLQYVKFCMNYSAECEAPSDQQSLPSADRAMEMLREINTSVNQAISPVQKPTDPMSAHWALSPAAGDCNDYAVTKRHALVAKGWPQSSLRLAVVRTDTGQGHLVLVVRLADGDVVLDNLSPAVRKWNAPAYEWISMQSSSDQRFWVAVGRHGERLRANRLASAGKSPL